MQWESFEVELPPTGGRTFRVTATRRGYRMSAEIPSQTMSGTIRPVLTSLTVSREPEHETPQPLSLREMRRLPLATFSEAARAAVAAVLDAPPAELSQELARATRARPPRGRPSRRGHSTAFYTKLADAYRGEVARGEPYPGASLAKRMKVSSDQMRVWIHRARKAGHLEPASE